MLCRFLNSTLEIPVRLLVSFSVQVSQLDTGNPGANHELTGFNQGVIKSLLATQLTILRVFVTQTIMLRVQPLGQSTLSLSVPESSGYRYKGGGLCYLELEEPLAWLPAEIARLSAPRQGLSYDSFGNGGFSIHNSPWGEHSQGSLERNLTQITDGDHCYGDSLCPPTDLKKLKEVYSTLLSSMEKKFLKKEARQIQMMLDSGLTMNQQHHSSMWDCSSQLIGGPVRSVDVYGVWEDARQALKEFKDQTDINRPMICMDQDVGLSLMQEMAPDFGKLCGV
ncbi:uncharacterized protein LOC119585968 [Penaeus monodon]|uniref:uncharacterized protein LOC119585968 n=1 Tax=Penaeus monodon TaxID=6687 RepID=UPI0018A7BBA6|nr:uncharacterized protein LOC119585968 [Penaeus monodon]